MTGHVSVTRVNRPLLVSAAAVSAIALISGFVWTVFGLPHAPVVSLGMEVPVAALAVISLAAAAIRLPGRYRLAWTSMAIGFVLVTADTIDTVLRVARGLPEDPTSLGVVLQEMAAPFAYAGVLFIVASFLRIGRIRTLLDSLIAVIGVLCMAWVLGIGDMYAASSLGTFDKVTTLLFPITDVLYFAPLLFLALTVPRHHKPSIGLLAAALLCTLGPDTHLTAMLFAGRPYFGGYVVEIGWIASLVCVSFGGILARPIVADDTAPRRVPLWRNSLPYVGVALCAVAVLGQQVIHGATDAVLVWELASLLVLLTVRQILALHENASLSEALREQSIRETEQRFAALVENSSDVIMVVDGDVVVRHVTGSIRRVMGVDPDAMVGRRLDEIIHTEDASGTIRHIAAIVGGAAPSPVEFRVRNGAGEWRSFEALPSTLLREGSGDRIVLNTRDVTERREMELMLRRDALHDPLTDLANRTLLMDRLQHALDVAQRNRRSVVLFFIDLDDFKVINDTAGHIVGDQVLTVVADRLRDGVRAADTPARFGGDEFALLVDDAPPPEGLTVLGEKLRASISEPILIGGVRHQVGASIGIAVSAEGDGVDQLMNRADRAMYAAKRRGKGAVVVDDGTVAAGLRDGTGGGQAGPGDGRA